MHAAAPAPTGGDDSLGGYRIWGRATPTAEGFAESLVGRWLLMDGASSIETISEDVVRVRNNRSGELWHFTFEADGSYAFRYVITYNRRALINVERGEWSSDGAQLTLTPSSCTTKGVSETTDCTEPFARTTSQRSWVRWTTRFRPWSLFDDRCGRKPASSRPRGGHGPSPNHLAVDRRLRTAASALRPAKPRAVLMARRS